MATKRKAAPSRSKVHKPPKKSAAKKPAARAKAAQPAAAQKAKAVKPAKAKAPAAKVTAAKVPAAKAPAAKAPAAKAPAGKAPAKGLTAIKGGKGKLKVAAIDRQAVARPLGTLPPSAVARAVRPSSLPARPAFQSVPRPQRETADEGAQGVTEKDYGEFEQRLLEERKKLLKEMGHLESTVLKVNQRDSAGDLSGYSFHMADVGTDAMEREKAFLFASNEGHLLREIDDALRKIYAGEYGSCENCQRPIARARLEAVPYARLCKACKENEERHSRGLP